MRGLRRPLPCGGHHIPALGGDLGRGGPHPPQLAVQHRRWHWHVAAAIAAAALRRVGIEQHGGGRHASAAGRLQVAAATRLVQAQGVHHRGQATAQPGRHDLIRRHRGNAFRQAALAQLTQTQREQFTSFINKAVGWFTVAVGAFLLAVEQTWQVIDRYRWPVWLFWLLIVVMLGASVLNTALRMIHDERQQTA